ncbi:hypothetical protein EJ08DRAFT_645941 [Tothia fuscella]|uniref:Uncharacterized protein n=1 Tax=Tothia fuscella TaxID=1048955 RepID=A0A9P4P148_9PEZI|nr:hypothetical protein EJ08DRAFT_645941 [Tothia fuscella]
MEIREEQVRQRARDIKWNAQAVELREKKLRDREAVSTAREEGIRAREANVRDEEILIEYKEEALVERQMDLMGREKLLSEREAQLEKRDATHNGNGDGKKYEDGFTGSCCSGESLGEYMANKSTVEEDDFVVLGEDGLDFEDDFCEEE